MIHSVALFLFFFVLFSVHTTNYEGFSYMRIINIHSDEYHQSIDVNIALNLESEMQAGKIRTNCEDVRFSDAQENEFPYWIEFCDDVNGSAYDVKNFALSSFWINAELQEGNNEIYMFYGNSDATVSLNHADFEDQRFFLLVKNSSTCTNGWKQATDLDGGYLYASENDEMSVSIVGKHSHEFTVNTEPVGDLVEIGDGSELFAAYSQHTHDPTIGETSLSSHELPRLEIPVCQVFSRLHYIPEGAIIPISEESSFDSFEGMASLKENTIDRFIMLTSAETESKEDGCSVLSHNTKTVVSEGISSNFSCASSSSVILIDHTHIIFETTVNSSDCESVYPQYCSVRFGTTKSDLSPIWSENRFYFFASALPPLGYEKVGNFEGKYIYGAGEGDAFCGGKESHDHETAYKSTYDEIVGSFTSQASFSSSGKNASVGEKHTHDVYITTSLVDSKDAFSRSEIIMVERKINQNIVITLGEEEDHITCFGKNNKDSDVCGGEGTCIEINVCMCNAGYYTKDTLLPCQEISCYGLPQDHEGVCNSHGVCSGPDNCTCNYTHNGKYCTIPTCSCNGIPYNEKDVCSGHGRCVAENVCECDSANYTDTYCQQWDCPTNEFNKVCSGNGECVDIQTCECYANNETGEYYYSGLMCESFNCFGFSNEDPRVCSRVGKCVNLDLCECETNYYGDSCQEFICEPSWEGKNEISVKYVMSYDYLEKIDTNSLYNCSLVVKEEDLERLGYGAFCNFSISQDNVVTSTLDITLGEDHKLLDDIVNISILSISKPNPSIDLELKKDEIVNLGALIASITGSLVFLGLIVLGLVFVLGIVYFLYRKNKKKADRFDSVKDLELIVEEAEAEGKSGEVAPFRIETTFFDVNYEDIEILEKIGNGGGMATIWKVKYRDFLYVFKCFQMSDFEEESKYKEFENEVKVISSVSHENILRFFGASVKEPRVGYLMKYCPLGDIKFFLSSGFSKFTKKDKFPFFRRLKFIMDISSGMRHLHSLDIIHRDLKCENVLIDGNEEISNLKAVLMDFGLSKIVSLNKTKTRNVGTSYYMAPEVILGHYNEKCDVFSFSMLFWEIICNDFKPFDKKSTFGIESLIAKDENLRPSFKKHVLPSWIKDLISKCWVHDFEYRPSFEKIDQEIRKNVKQKQNLPVKISGNDFTLKCPTLEDLENCCGEKGNFSVVLKDGTLVPLTNDYEAYLHIEENSEIVLE